MQLPLFPLGTVLFPGMPLPLHIFEPRYLQMIRFCVDERSPFVVALIRSGAEALGPLAEPYAVGCTASIRQVASIGGGRLKVDAVGVDRVKIDELSEERPYLCCRAEAASWTPAPDEDLEASAATLRRLIAKYVMILAASETVRLPDLETLQPLKLAWLAADLLQIRMPRKQELLEASDPVTLFAELAATYRSEIALLSAISDQKQANTDGDPTSLN